MFLLLIILLLQMNLFLFSDSSDIWSKTLKSIKEGKTKAPKGMNYFIFDELNVTALDINGNKMNSLYQSQKVIFDNKGISNYIFVVGHLNEGKDKMQDITTNLANYLKND